MIFLQFIGSDEETSFSQNMKIVVQIYTNISIIAWKKNILMRFIHFRVASKNYLHSIPQFFFKF